MPILIIIKSKQYCITLLYKKNRPFPDEKILYRCEIVKMVATGHFAYYTDTTLDHKNKTGREGGGEE